MGVDTKAIINKGTTILQIENYLKDKFSSVKIENTSNDDFFYFDFVDGKDNRSLGVFFNDYAKSDYKIDGTLLSLGFWGNSVEIIKGICTEFGGYIDENDCDDDGFYAIEKEKFLQGDKITPYNMMINEVVAAFGIHKVDKFLEIGKRYSSQLK